MTVFTKRRLATAVAFATGVALATPTAWSIETTSIFELEGDATTENTTTPGPDDWANILNQGAKSTVGTSIAKLVTTTSGGSIAWPGVINDPAPDTTFTTGGGKDILDVSSWMYTTGSVPDKDDITDAFAAGYVLKADIAGTGNKNGDLILFFGLDRFGNGGDADLGFWFFQSTIGLQPLVGHSAGFTGVHTVGDILVLMNFTTGGTVPTVQILEWVASGGDVSTNLKTLTPLAGGQCDTSTDQVFCGITNATNSPAPWPYTPKAGTTGTFPPVSFFEGGINITRVFREFLGNTPLPCLTSFMAETRSSQSPTAVLKDFILGSFQICGFDVTKSCTAGQINQAQTGFTWTFSGTVTNTGAGTLFNVAVSDTPTGGSPTNVTTFSSIAAGQTVSYGPATYDTIGSTPNPASDTVTVTAATSSGGPVVLTKMSNLATCPHVPVSPMLSVNKTCNPLDTTNGGPQASTLGAFLKVVNNEIVVEVTVNAHVCNTGNINLVNLNVTDDDGGGTNTPDTLATTDSLAAGACKDYTHTFIPNGSGLTLPASASTITLSDTVTATANSVLGGSTGPQTGTAHCPLCR